MKVVNVMWIAVCLVCFVVGLLGGYVLHQDHMFKGMVMVAEGLEGTVFNIEVDINETLIVDRMHENFKEMGFYDLENETEIISESNKTNEDFFFYYTNKFGPDPYIGKYRLNGEFDLEDKDDLGDCWSYNGSDGSVNWRIVNIEDMIEPRRCGKPWIKK